MEKPAATRRLCARADPARALRPDALMMLTQRLWPNTAAGSALPAVSFFLPPLRGCKDGVAGWRSRQCVPQDSQRRQERVFAIKSS